MALKTCIECGKEHTDTIANCPHCGFVTKEHPSIDITQDKEKKKFKLQGLMDKGYPLMNTFRVIGFLISTFFIGLFFVKYMVGFIIINVLFLFISFPYLHHNKNDNKIFKGISYTIWGVVASTSIYDLFALYIWDIETTKTMNFIIMNLFPIIKYYINVYLF